MRLITTTKNLAGERSGNVMLRKRLQRLAPSSFAAS